MSEKKTTKSEPVGAMLRVIMLTRTGESERYGIYANTESVADPSSKKDGMKPLLASGKVYIHKAVSGAEATAEPGYVLVPLAVWETVAPKK